MTRLLTILTLLALLVPFAGTAQAGVDWDGDPMFRVGGTNVHVSFSIDGGNFVHSGGQVLVTATGQDIRLLGRGPRWFTAQTVQGGEAGAIILATSLFGANAPDTFEIRVQVAGTRIDVVRTVEAGVPYTFSLTP